MTATKATPHDSSDLDVDPAPQRMSADFQRGPAIYHPSKFWSAINEKHLDWLSHGGLEDFKRSLNNSYFQFHISSKSDYFRHALMRFFRLAARHPSYLRFLVLGRISDFRGKTTQNEDYRRSWRQRYLYKLYVLALYSLISADDEFGLLARLDEPLVGHPVVVRLGPRRLSQDLCNSYAEYAYIRRTLGAAFDGLHSIAEIGAGYGRLIYIFQALHPSVRTFIADIPPALLVAEWYLRRVFPERSARGYLDAPDPPPAGASDPVMTFMLPQGLEYLPDKSLDLVINVSSLHEMTFDQIETYFALVDRKARYFYLKQWFNWTNETDNQNVSIMSYPVRRHWRLLNLRLNPTNSRMFEALFQLP